MQSASRTLMSRSAEADWIEQTAKGVGRRALSNIKHEWGRAACFGRASLVYVLERSEDDVGGKRRWHGNVFPLSSSELQLLWHRRPVRLCVQNTLGSLESLEMVQSGIVQGNLSPLRRLYQPIQPFSPT